MRSKNATITDGETPLSWSKRAAKASDSRSASREYACVASVAGTVAMKPLASPSTTPTSALIRLARTTMSSPWRWCT